MGAGRTAAPVLPSSDVKTSNTLVLNECVVPERLPLTISLFRSHRSFTHGVRFMEALFLVGLLALALLVSVAALVRQVRVQWALRKLLMRLLTRWRNPNGH
jgi:uncharacterized membrane protein YidH (DUF202 family)